MIYSCEYCHFVFENEDFSKQCPDCGKYTVRPATEAEEREYYRIQIELASGLDNWYQQREEET